MTAYATKEELQEYLHVNDGCLPPDVERMLDRATEDINHFTLDNITDSDAHQTAAKNATMAQVEFWLETGDELNANGNLKSIKVGNFSASYGSTQGSGSSSQMVLAPRAERFLQAEYLLFAGIQLGKEFITETEF